MREALRSGARQVRQAALSGFGALGGLRWVSGSRWRSKRLLILCYHGLAMKDEHVWNGGLFMSAEFLRRRFEMLKSGGYQVLPFGEAVAALRKGTLPPRSVALTFDDGFHDFLRVAVPLLEEFGYPATNYVSSYYTLNQHPIPPVALRYVLWKSGRPEIEAGTLRDQPETLVIRDAKQRHDVAMALLQKVSAAGEDAQQALMADVAARLGVDWDAVVRDRLFHLMTPEEVSETARRGFDIQLHTHRHRTPRDKAAFCREITENRAHLEAMTGRPANHFCYPSGDVDAMFLPWLRELGVETATTTGDAGIATAGDDSLLLPRFVDTMWQPDVMFESWVAGAGAMLRRRSA